MTYELGPGEISMKYIESGNFYAVHERPLIFSDTIIIRTFPTQVSAAEYMITRSSIMREENFRYWDTRAKLLEGKSLPPNEI